MFLRKPAGSRLPVPVVARAYEPRIELTLIVRNTSLAITASADCSARVWDWLTGECLETLHLGKRCECSDHVSHNQNPDR